MLRLYLSAKGLPEGQLAGDISSESLESWRHVHRLALGFEKLLQEGFDFFIHGRLEDA